MKIKVYTGKIKNGQVTNLGTWKEAEYLRSKEALIYELIGAAYCYIPKENTFKIDKFEVFKGFAESKKYTIDEIMKNVVISLSPIEKGESTEAYVEPIIDNGFGIYYGYHHKA